MVFMAQSLRLPASCPERVGSNPIDCICGSYPEYELFILFLYLLIYVLLQLAGCNHNQPIQATKAITSKLSFYNFHKK